jgi:hypothetical protein
MTAVQITPPAPRTEALAAHAYCLPIVRELPVLLSAGSTAAGLSTK